MAIMMMVDLAVGMAAGLLRQRAPGGVTHKAEYIRQRADEELVIVGSSRASHHIVPRILRDSLGVSVYNAGMDGMGIVYNYGVLLQLLRHGGVRTVIYELTPWNDYLTDDNGQYLPNLRNAYGVPGVDSLFWSVDPSERIKMMSGLYRVNSMLPRLGFDNLSAATDTLWGYEPLWSRYAGASRLQEEDPSVSGKYEYDPLKIDLLKKFIRTCRERNIQLVFSVSPYLDRNYSYRYGMALAEKERVPVVTFRSEPQFFEDISLYQDPSHLNNTGAELYTRWLVGKLKPILADSPGAGRDTI